MPLTATLIAATLIADPKITFKRSNEVRKDRFEINLMWPVFLPESPLNKMANDAVKDSVHKNMFEFKKGINDLGEKPVAPWEHQVACTVSLATPTLISVLVDTYDYSGGAHPNGWTDTINYGIISGKPKQLALKDILTANAEEKEILDLLVLPRVSNDRLKRSGDIVESLPEDTNKKFLISKNGITFPFDKYSVASYAEGEFIVKLTWKDLRGLIDTKVVPYAMP